MLFINYLHLVMTDPLSRFPQGGKAEKVTLSTKVKKGYCTMQKRIEPLICSSEMEDKTLLAPSPLPCSAEAATRRRRGKVGL